MNATDVSFASVSASTRGPLREVRHDRAGVAVDLRRDAVDRGRCRGDRARLREQRVERHDVRGISRDTRGGRERHRREAIDLARVPDEPGDDREDRDERQERDQQRQRPDRNDGAQLRRGSAVRSRRHLS